MKCLTISSLFLTLTCLIGARGHRRHRFALKRYLDAGTDIFTARHQTQKKNSRQLYHDERVRIQLVKSFTYSVYNYGPVQLKRTAIILAREWVCVHVYGNRFNCYLLPFSEKKKNIFSLSLYVAGIDEWTAIQIMDHYFGHSQRGNNNKKKVQLSMSRCPFNPCLLPYEIIRILYGSNLHMSIFIRLSSCFFFFSWVVEATTTTVHPSWLPGAVYFLFCSGGHLVAAPKPI